jgi:hypothetical protein
MARKPHWSTTPLPPPEVQSLRVNQAAVYLGVSPTFLNLDASKNGRHLFRYAKIGGLRVYLKQWLDEDRAKLLVEHAPPSRRLERRA